MIKKNKRLPSTKIVTPPLRLRVFDGPNGSGKSTVIRAVQKAVVNGKSIDLGYYINADDITRSLKNSKFSFSIFKVKLDLGRLFTFTESAGLLRGDFSLKVLQRSIEVYRNTVMLKDEKWADHIGQVIARFLREEMLRLKRRFSFETVFSHHSNLDIMERACDAGYKVYLYYVSTESVEINKYRVQLRVLQGGHNVRVPDIESRYIRSMDLLYKAAQITYQTYFFDNSKENSPLELVAHFKKVKRKSWDKIDKQKVPNWFYKYYSAKVKRKKKDI